MQASEGLGELRREIDRIDDLLAARFALLARVAAYKRPRDIPVAIPERIAEVVERCVARGQALGLDAKMLRDLYDRIIDEACRVETRVIEAARRPVAAVGGDD